MATSAASVALTGSKSLTTHRDSQMVFKFDDLSWIECNELVLQLRESKTSTMVQAPLFFGHRSLLRWARLRRCMAVDGDGELRQLPQLGKMLRRRGFSPGCFQGARRRTSGMEMTTTSPIPASRCKEERWKSGDWGWMSSIPEAWMLNPSWRSSGDSSRGMGGLIPARWSSPELGFVVTCRDERERGKGAALGFSLAAEIFL
jgi:hypothetical protein